MTQYSNSSTPPVQGDTLAQDDQWPKSEIDFSGHDPKLTLRGGVVNALPVHKSNPDHSTLQQEPVGSRFQRVSIDIMGELPETSNGNKYVLVLCDYFKKWNFTGHCTY